MFKFSSPFSCKHPFAFSPVYAPVRLPFREFIVGMATKAILTDCLHGFLLSASIVFIFLGATSLSYYFRHLREVGAQDAVREEDGETNGARAARRPPGQANRNLVGDVNVEDQQDRK
ncbi:ubiquitin-protein ligase [Lithospermum erythrorhizon]|uniref:RING-type E3 ubiquitin transferase n=1 Tax=Lithospermum erythrorhizon TaxID=34254 RepID=A0AAV3QXK8_LITER